MVVAGLIPVPAMIVAGLSLTVAAMIVARPVAMTAVVVTVTVVVAAMTPVVVTVTVVVAAVTPAPTSSVLSPGVIGPIVVAAIGIVLGRGCGGARRRGRNEGAAVAPVITRRVIGALAGERGARADGRRHEHCESCLYPVRVAVHRLDLRIGWWMRPPCSASRLSFNRTSVVGPS